jgi:hypothetical protein
MEGTECQYRARLLHLQQVSHNGFDPPAQARIFNFDVRDKFSNFNV